MQLGNKDLFYLRGSCSCVEMGRYVEGSSERLMDKWYILVCYMLSTIHDPKNARC